MPLPNHKWSIKPNKAQYFDVIHAILDKRGLTDSFIDPELLQLPNPFDVFSGLNKACILTCLAIKSGYKIAISGDYDVDGMTSTCLLLKVFRALGATVDYAIPNRMGEGYGLNKRIVNDFYEQGYKLLVTVDNGTAAVEPIKLAKELGMIVIVTDHHEPPSNGLPPADAILNPKFVPQDNVWSQVSGVGMAFVYGLCVAEKAGLNPVEFLQNECTELLTLGTIADMVSLTGVNRRWVSRGLRLIPNSQNYGVQALMAAAGLELGGSIKPHDIGFKLAPRINSVGRIGDPQLIIELFTTDDLHRAMHLAHEVEELDKKRKDLVKEWTENVFGWIDTCLEVNPNEFKGKKVIYFAQQGIHKGIVGLIASRVVEKYGYPAFIGSISEFEGGFKISGSARGGFNFNVHEALNYCDHYLLTHGGHKAAGGFSLHLLDEQNFHDKLIEYANKNLKSEDLGRKLIFVDHELSFMEISSYTYFQIQSLQPFGMGNYEPVFFTPNVKVIRQDKINYPGAVKFIFEKDGIQVRALGWDYESFLPLPEYVDIAYKLKENVWQDRVTIELDLVSVKSNE